MLRAVGIIHLQACMHGPSRVPCPTRRARGHEDDVQERRCIWRQFLVRAAGRVTETLVRLVRLNFHQRGCLNKLYHSLVVDC
jgi:hypothetical protein